MRSSVSYKNLISASVIPLFSVAVWALAIDGVLKYNWSNPIWENMLFLLIVLDILFVISIYPIAILIKCFLYERDTVLEYNETREMIIYERKEIKVSFSFSEVKSFVQIRPLLRSSLGAIYEIELISGHVITITDLLAVSQEFEKHLKITGTYYERILFRTFYNHIPTNDISE